MKDKDADEIFRFPDWFLFSGLLHLSCSIVSFALELDSKFSFSCSSASPTASPYLPCPTFKPQRLHHVSHQLLHNLSQSKLLSQSHRSHGVCFSCSIIIVQCSPVIIVVKQHYPKARDTSIMMVCVQHGATKKDDFKN